MGLKVACQPFLMPYRSHRGALRPNTLLDDSAEGMCSPGIPKSKSLKSNVCWEPLAASLRSFQVSE